MTHNQNIVEKLSQFNNLSFTRKQWDIILKGCGCPKSSHFWTALRRNNLVRKSRMYTLIDIDNKAFSIIWEQYCVNNRAGVKKSYNKAKARKQAQERKNSLKGTTFYIVGGILTTEKPKREW